MATQWSSDDIAVIGLACRFPGGASNEHKLWELLSNSKSAYSKVPKNRYNVDAFHQAGASHLNNLSAPGAHFLTDDVSSFDAPFFSITAEEAKAMDPAARMLLELSYEAVENAGIPMKDLVHSDTGCYVGCFTRDYHELLMKDLESAPMYAGTGTGFSLFSNRISWFYDLRGPSMTLDTACSSSLVGLHLACQSLKSGESKMALVCGANLLLSPDLGVFLSNLHMLSHEGKSRAFADGVSGYGRGEGIASVVLKPLADALRDGDAIRAVIRGSGVNQDGHTKGITVPSSEAQANLIRTTYRNAGLDFSETSFFEAHGTGTGVGDPLELAAVARAIKESKYKGSLYVGSVKSNLGHLEGAAGLAGLIKCILMLEKGYILPNIYFDRPNKRIPFDSYQIEVPTSLIPWPAGQYKRTSVNSFGYGGTNAHAILDSYHQGLPINGLHTNGTTNGDCEKAQTSHLFLFSARDESALERIRTQYVDHLEHLDSSTAADPEYLRNLSFTLGSRRSKLDWTSFIVAGSVDELRFSLSGSKFRPNRSGRPPRIGFIFTGQGAQWPRMGMGLMKYAAFRNSIIEAEDYLKKELSCAWSLTEELGRPDADSKIQLAKFSQPICTVLQIALVDLLRTWNIEPVAVAGHSSGEIGAAYCIGAITKQTAWKVSYIRGELCSGLKSKTPELRGSMMAVGLGSNEVKAYISTISAGRLTVACVNSPSSVTISGDEAGVDELLGKLKVDSVFARKLKVENAYHSHHMGFIAPEYLEAISDIKTQKPTSDIKMTSSVTGQPIDFTDLDASYWVKNLVSPVLFSDAVRVMSRKSAKGRRYGRKADPSIDFLIEIGPHAALKGPVRQILKEEGLEDIGYASLLFRGQNDIVSAVTMAGELASHGASINISAVNDFQGRAKTLLNLPSYPWNHSHKYWAIPRLTQNYLQRKFPRHNLLGTRLLGTDDLEPTWRNFLRVSDNPWVEDHQVHGAILYPGSGILVMCIEAALQLADEVQEVDNVRLKDVRIGRAIVVPDDQATVETFVRLRRHGLSADSSWSGWWNFVVSSVQDGQDMIENGFGMIKLEYKTDAQEKLLTGRQIIHEARRSEYAALKAKNSTPIDPAQFYEATKAAGLNYGPSFQGLTEIAAGKGSVCCTVEIPDTKERMPGNLESKHIIHPTTLDIILHSLFAALSQKVEDFRDAAVPVAFDNVVISTDLPSGPKAQFVGFSSAKRTAAREIMASIYMSDARWDSPKVQIDGLRCTELPGSKISYTPSENVDGPIGTMVWKEDVDMLDEEAMQSFISNNYAVRRFSISRRSSITDSDVPSKGLQKVITQIIGLMAYKKPSLEILQIGGVSLDVISAVLPALQPDVNSTHRFSRYVVAEFSSENVADAEIQYESMKPEMSFKQLDSDLSLDQQGFSESSFDVVLIATKGVGKQGVDKQQFISDTQKFLRPGGKTVVLEAVQHNSDTSFADDSGGLGQTRVGQFDGIVLADPTSSTTISLATKPFVEDPKTESDSLYLLKPHAMTDRTSKICSNLAGALKEKGFQVSTVSWPVDVEELKGKSIISLLEMDRPFLSDIGVEDFEALKLVLLQSKTLLWVCMGNHPVMALATGLVRVLHDENPNLKLRYLLLEERIFRPVSNISNAILKVATSPSEEREYMEMNGEMCIPRWQLESEMTRVVAAKHESFQYDHMHLEDVRCSLRLAMPKSGFADFAHFIQDQAASGELEADEVEIKVEAIVLSDLDLASVDDNVAGLFAREASGVITSVGSRCSTLRLGDRVCASFLGYLCSTIHIKESQCQKIPDSLSYEQAARLPLTFAVAYRALVDIARLRPGQSVLIQAAASSLGQAAISIAKASRAVVFATSRNDEEIGLLEDLGISRNHILVDGDPDLAIAMLSLTRERGADVVLCTTESIDTVRSAWRCIASFGTFVDVSGAASVDAGIMDREPFQRGATFSAVNAELMLQQHPLLMQQTLKEALNLLQENTTVDLSRSKTFPSERVVEALKFQQSHGSVGSVILTFDKDDMLPISPKVKNKLRLSRNASYLICGGLGGLGRSLAKFMVGKGARNLIFLSRSGPAAATAVALTEELATLGTTIKIYACDVGDESALEKTLAQCSRDMPPIKGVVQSAAIIKDSIFERVTHDSWKNTLWPKVQGTWNLHKRLPKDMDFFVILASVAGTMGHRSQAAYATGNVFQDALAHHRRKLGLPAVSLDLAPMLDVGLISESGTVANFSQSEAVWLKEVDLHAIMSMAMSGSLGKYEVPPQICTGMPSGGMLQKWALEHPLYFSDSRFSFLKKLDTTASEVLSNQGPVDAVAMLLASIPMAKSASEAADGIINALSARLAKDLQCSVDNIDRFRPLHDYGIDSLMAVEIRTWIIMKMQAEVSLFDVLSGGSLNALAIKIAKTSKLVAEGLK